MTHWLAMMLVGGTYEGATVVEPTALLPALTPQMVSNPPSQPDMRSGFYGYGFNIGTRQQPGCSSATRGLRPGAATNFVMIPAADVAIVALTNAAPIGVPETLTAEFADLVQFGQVRQDWRTLYAHAFEKWTVVRRTGRRGAGQLRRRRARRSPRRHLRQRLLGSGRCHRHRWDVDTDARPQTRPSAQHLGRRNVHLRRDSENAPAGSVSAATFAGDRLVLEYFNQDRMGTFTR